MGRRLLQVGTGPKKPRRRKKNTAPPAAQKMAYRVPADLRGSSKDNWQMVFGTGTFGYREDDLSLFFREFFRRDFLLS